MHLFRQERRTLSKSHRGGSPDSSLPCGGMPVFFMLIGMVVGGLFTYMVVADGSSHVVDTRVLDTLAASTAPAATTALRQQQSNPIVQQSKQESEGWHPIHVFYGKKEGLQLDPNKEWFAQVHQDEILMDLIGPNGYFIDLAANDAKELSNTVALEKHGWNGLCIEPNPIYWYGLSHRKCTVVGALVGGPEVQKVAVKFRGVYGGILGKMDEKMANRKKEPDSVTEERYTVSFASLLREYNAPKMIDYLSLDVEGAEYLVMQHFPFDQYTIRILTVERPSNELKALLNQHGYAMVKSLAWWGETLWAHESTGFTATHPKIAKIVEEGK